jgi:hypothetical protein
VAVSAPFGDTDETAPVPLARRDHRVVKPERGRSQRTDGRRGFRRSIVNSTVAFRPDVWWR